MTTHRRRLDERAHLGERVESSEPRVVCFLHPSQVGDQSDAAGKPRCVRLSATRAGGRAGPLAALLMLVMKRPVSSITRRLGLLNPKQEGPGAAHQPTLQGCVGRMTPSLRAIS